jgi:hypothetical protein
MGKVKKEYKCALITGSKIKKKTNKERAGSETAAHRKISIYRSQEPPTLLLSVQHKIDN